MDIDVEKWYNLNGGGYMYKANPYRPGAGLMPTYLAGRDEDIANIEEMFDALVLNVPTPSVMFSGLRGVGKTVLINEIQKKAEQRDIFCKHIAESCLQHMHRCVFENVRVADDRVRAAAVE